MISSRCKDSIEYKGQQSTLTAVRVELEKRIESLRFTPSQGMFSCWINELETSREGNSDAWDECLKQVKDADIVLCIYNGNAGWATNSSGIGICHAELITAMSTGAVKLRILQEETPEFEVRTTGKDASKLNIKMKDYVAQQNLFRGKTFKSGEELIELALAALTDCVIEMTRIGSSEGRAGRYDSGQALDWSRLDFVERKAAMEAVLRDAISGQAGSTIEEEASYVKVGKEQILVLCHAIPAAISVASAREMVGMPFLRDHERADLLGKNQIGPLHMIACHKGVTEAQAMNLLGFPDAIFVTTSFGVYVADKVQKIQLLLLKNCRDEATTRHAVQRAFDWLSRSGEATYLSERAKSRKKIVQAVAREQA